VRVVPAGIVPFLHTATRTRRPLMWLWVVLYTAAAARDRIRDRALVIVG
jgi:hypothetical protein